MKRLSSAGRIVSCMIMVLCLWFMNTPYGHAQESYEFVLKFGNGAGQFAGPEGVATDSDGNVYVADSANHRIQKFSSSGSFILEWGSIGSEDGQFWYPWGIAIDAEDNVYVSDGLNHRIQKFTAGGDYITQWGFFGSGDGQFIYPRGVTVDSPGKVYVADEWNNRIQKFQRTDGSASFTLRPPKK